MVNHGNTTKYFPGLINKNQRLSRTLQDSKKNPGLFQDVATLILIFYITNQILLYITKQETQSEMGCGGEKSSVKGK